MILHVMISGLCDVQLSRVVHGRMCDHAARVNALLFELETHIVSHTAAGFELRRPLWIVLDNGASHHFSEELLVALKKKKKETKTTMRQAPFSSDG